MKRKKRGYFFVLEIQFFRIDHRVMTDVTVCVEFFAPRTAGGANVAVSPLGVEIDGVGQTVKVDDLFPLIIIVVKTALLFKTEALFFAVVKKNGERCVQTEVIIGISRRRRVVGGRVGAGKSRFEDGSRKGAIGKKTPHPKEDDPRHSGDQHPQPKPPAHHTAVVGICLMIGIIGKRAAKPCGKPKDIQERAAEIA